MHEKLRMGFTILEIMIVVSIIGLLAAISIPSFVKARRNSQKTTCMKNMREIVSASDQWAMEYRKAKGTAFTWDDIRPYLKEIPVCPAGGTYDELGVGEDLYCTIHDWRNDNPEYNGWRP